MASAAPGDRLRAAAERAAGTSGAPLAVSARRGSDTASFVRRADGGDLLPGPAHRTPSGKAADYLARHADLFGIRDAAAELRPLGSSRDALGWTHLAWEQVHGGIEVFGASLRAHVAPDGALRVVNGTAVPIPGALAVVPLVPSAEAERVARAATRGAATAVLASRLVVYAPGLLRGIEGDARLAHAVEVLIDAFGRRDLVLVDGLDGRVLDRIRLTPDALARQVAQSSPGNVVWVEGNPDPIPGGWAGGSAARVAAWQDEIDGAREAYNLVGSVSRGTYLGFDGADGLMRTVHEASGLSCPNAAWDGTATNYCAGVTSDDVVAHEWGHAYTEHTSGLIYAWQPGALNESYSDVWGETVDRLNGRGTDAPGPPRTADGSACALFGSYDPGLPAADASYRWLVGEDSTAFGTPIRDMWHPECRFDPGRVGSARYFCDATDQGGVHTNSGVPNHLYALLVDGGSYNGEAVGALGLTKAASILWRATSVYETQVSDFADHADAVEQSCADLTGAPLGEAVTTAPASWTTSVEVITSTDCDEVAAAVAAVELRAEPPCIVMPILAPGAPALCSGLGAVETLSASDFEASIAPWTPGNRAVANPLTYDGGTWSRVTALPDGRAGAAAFTADPIVGDCAADDETGVSTLDGPLLVLPADRPVPRVAFDHWVATEPGYDGGNLKVSVNGGAFQLVPTARFGFNPYNRTLVVSGNTCPLAGEVAWSGTDGGSLDGSWGQSQLDLSGIAAPGDTIQLRFELGMDGCNGNTGWYVDDVHVYTCSDETTPPPLCPPEPLPGCRTTPSGRATLLVADSAVDQRDRLNWSWSRGAATSLADFGNPLTTTSYAFCIWDGRGGTPELVSATEIPPVTGWRPVGATGFRYSDPKATATGIAQLRVRAGADGKASAVVRAKGGALDLPAAATALQRFEATPAVTVQLVTSAGACWQSAFTASDLARNTVPLTRGTHVGP
jgi:bacillolysin